jgi:sulfoxide reductase heme-binding subunit YedZ
MPVRQLLLLPQTKYLLYGVLALPFVWLIWALFHDALGANPAEALSRATGDWTLRLLCVVLAVTPLRRLTGLSELIRFRRSIGLACFYYACLHLLCYAWFDQSFEVNEMAKDLVKRPFIWLGMICFVLMLPLALTSHNAAVRWLGGKRWQQLHKWVYVLPVFALLHFYWMRAGKNNFAEVWVYLAILSGLLLSRLWFKLNNIRVG